MTVEQLMFEEKNKAQRLQTELDVSEQVQRDFVKLSQTLQVRPWGAPGNGPLLRTAYPLALG